MSIISIGVVIVAFLAGLEGILVIQFTNLVACTLIGFGNR